jgi:putative transposase
MTKTTDTSMLALLANEVGYDPIQDRLRQNIRASMEALFEEELAAVIGRCRYGRGGTAKKGYRNGHRERQLVGPLGTETLSVPRARIENEEGKITEWRSKALPRYQRLTKKAEALIASVYLAGANTRRVKRALYGLFQGAVGKDVVARAWRQGEGGLGRVVRPPIWPTKISSVSFWTAPSSRPDATARPRTSRCWRPSVCAGMARRFCYPS